MRRTYLGLCVISRDGANSLNNLFDSILKPKPAFQEFSFCDTGSIDITRSIIANRLLHSDLNTSRLHACARKTLGLNDVYEPGGDLWSGEPFWASQEKDSQIYFEKEWLSRNPNWEPPENYYRIILSTFKWTDSFSDARNFSFRLATSRWLCYLDCDDAIDLAQNLIPTIKKSEAKDPNINTICLPYDYNNDNSFIQDKYRIFKDWNKGNFYWNDNIHENVQQKTGNKIIAKYQDIVVRHIKTDEDVLKSLIRNIRICSNSRDKAIKENNIEKAGLMSYYLGLYSKARYLMSPEGEAKDRALEETFSHLSFCVSSKKMTNISSYALFEMAKIHLDKEEYEEAAELAGLASAHAPELPESYLVLGIAHFKLGDCERSVRNFDIAFKNPCPIRINNDIVFNEIIARLYAAEAYLGANRYSDAEQHIQKIPDWFSKDNNLLNRWNKVYAKLMKTVCLGRLRDYIDSLIWNTQAPLALKMLKEGYVPQGIEDSPQIQGMIRELENKLPHMKGWKEFKETYEAIPATTYHTRDDMKDFVLKLTRTRLLKEWASSLPKEGPDITICSVGFQDGIIESESLLKINSRIKLTVCDVSSLAKENELSKEFPGRISTHYVKNDTYDWPNQKFDAVIIFEVLEHLPDTRFALKKLHSMLKDDGVLFLSTPVGSQWIEPYLTDPKLAPSFYGHVTSFNPRTLWNFFREAGFEGSILEGPDATFFAKMHCQPILKKITKGES